MNNAEQVVKEAEQTLGRTLDEQEREILRGTLRYAAAELRDAIDDVIFRPFFDGIASAMRKMLGK